MGLAARPGRVVPAVHDVSRDAVADTRPRRRGRPVRRCRHEYAPCSRSAVPRARRCSTVVNVRAPSRLSPVRYVTVWSGRGVDQRGAAGALPGSGGRPGCQWQPKTAHLRQLKTAYFRGGRLGRVRTCSCQATLKTDPRKNGVCRSTTMIRVGPVSSAPSRRASAGSGQQRTGEHARGSGRRRRFPPGAVGRADTGCNPETAVPVRRAPNPAIPPRPVSVVDGRDAPSRPGRKAHNCHLSRGADGVSPGGP